MTIDTHRLTVVLVIQTEISCGGPSHCIEYGCIFTFISSSGALLASLFSALTLSAGRREGHPARKNLGVGVCWWWRWLELCTTYSSSSPVDPPRWTWGKQVRGMWYFPFSALTLLVGQQEGHPARKSWVLGFVGDDDLTGALHVL